MDEGHHTICLRSVDTFQNNGCFLQIFGGASHYKGADYANSFARMRALQGKYLPEELIFSQGHLEAIEIANAEVITLGKCCAAWDCAEQDADKCASTIASQTT